MLRLLFIIIFLIIFFTASIPLYLILWIIGKFNRNARHIISLRIVQWAFKVIIFITGSDITCVGLENIPKDEAVLFVGNHRGFFDIIISYSMMPNLTGYVSKKEIGNVPFLGTWMKLVNCLFMDRSDIKASMKTILLGIERIKSGISIFIFPEGTRAKQGESMKNFKEGSLKMAQKTGCKVIPVAFCNTSAIFEDHLPFIKKAKVYLEFGKPIVLEELAPEDKKHLGRYTHDKIQQMIQAAENDSL